MLCASMRGARTHTKVTAYRNACPPAVPVTPPNSLQLCRIAGVSFEGRQALIARLRQGQGLAFVKEPTNQYDPHSVRVQTLAGDTLGYIPK